MGYIHKHILGNLGKTQVIHPKGTTTISVDSLVISNIHSTDSCIIDLFLFNNPTVTTTEKFYIIKNLTISKGTSVVFDSTDIGYDPTIYTLYLHVNSSASTVDLKLKTT